MKKIFGVLSLALVIVLGCNQPPLIMQTQYSLTLPGDVGTSGNINFDTFQSTASGTETALTFTNADGDALEFQISGFKTGTFTMGTGNTMTGTFNINDANGNPTIVDVQDSQNGFININGVNGSGSNITGMTGTFKVNIQTASQDGSLPGNGVIEGTFNF